MYQEIVIQIEKIVEEMIDDVHTVLPGKILAFHTQKGTVDVIPLGKCRLSDGMVLDYPRIMDAPLVFPYSEGSDAGMVFPVCKGDICLILISEIELDELMDKAVSEGTLKYDLTNAVVIPGIFGSSVNAVKEAVEKNAVILSCKGSRIELSEDGIQIKGNVVIDGTLSHR